MHSLKAFLLLFAILLVIFAHTYAQEEIDDEIKCTHDHQDDLDDVDLVDLEEDFSPDTNEDRLLASKTYPHFRIHANYDHLSSAPSSFRNYIKSELMPPVISWFQGALRVKYPVSGTIKRTTSTICSSSTPSDLRRGVSADFYFLLKYKTVNTDVVVSSRVCAQASGTRRPIIAMSNINTRQVVSAKGNVLVFERHQYLFIHEMMHNFGFSANLYPSFLDENGNTRRGHIKRVSLNGQTRTVLDIPFLTQRARKHFGCSSLPCLYMENGGGSGTAGSHLDKKFFLWDVMTSGGYYGRRVSEFSLGLMEATGWFAPDYDYAEPFYWGQGQGCGFITQKCSSTKASFHEFCTGSSRGCSDVGRSGGSCSSDTLTDGCRYQKPNLNYDCENPNADSYARLPSLQVFGRGVGSKCFSGNLNTKSSSSTTSFCFKYTCTGSGSLTQLQVHVGKKTVTCSSAGKVSVSGYYGSINCPDPIEFCSTIGKPYCPRNCSNRGSCVSGKCVCNSGFKGVDCALNA